MKILNISYALPSLRVSNQDLMRQVLERSPSQFEVSNQDLMRQVLERSRKHLSLGEEAGEEDQEVFPNVRHGHALPSKWW